MAAGEFERRNDAAALRAGQRVRPFGILFRLILAYYSALFAGGVLYAILARLGAFPRGADIPPAEAGLFVAGVLSLATVFAWLCQLRVAIQIAPAWLTFWDWRGGVHEIRWDEVTEAHWFSPWARMNTPWNRWDLMVRYRQRYVIGGPTRKLRFGLYLGWRADVAEALRDEIVRRSGLSLVEDTKSLWRGKRRVWLRPEA